MQEMTIEELAAKARKDYYREWRAANKEKTAEHRRRYWEKKALAKLKSAQDEEVCTNDSRSANDEKR